MNKSCIKCKGKLHENVYEYTHIYRYGYYVKRHFQHYFNYIVAVSFVGKGNRRTRRNQTTDLS